MRPPPAADEAFPQAGVANAAKVYLQHIYEAQQQYSIAVEQLHGLVKGRRYPTLGVIKWGEPYATMQKRLLARLYLHLSICTNTLGKDNIEGAVNSAIFYAEQSIGASTGDDPAVEDYARLQLAVAKVERNDKGDLKAATSALRELWSAKGSVLYKKSRNAVLKKLRAMIKGRKERDKKNKDKDKNKNKSLGSSSRKSALSSKKGSGGAERHRRQRAHHLLYHRDRWRARVAVLVAQGFARQKLAAGLWLLLLAGRAD